MARAVAPLEALLDYARPLIDEHTPCIMLKGEGAPAEIAAAGRRWTMKVELIQSISDSRGVIVKLSGMVHV